MSTAPISRRATAILLLAAGVIITAGMLVTPWEDEATTASYLQAIAVDPAQSQVAAVLLWLGYLLMAPALVGLLCALPSSRWRLTAAITGIVARSASPACSSWTSTRSA